MLDAVIYSLAGYLSGSLLFSQIAMKLFHSDDVTVNCHDHNPGVYNAFKNGGMAVGLFTLAGDLLKGFLPVFLYLHNVPFGARSEGLAFVMAAPVVGTLFPFWRKFRGGIGITAAFGALLGCVPNLGPALCLAIPFIIFSCILVVNPHYYRTLLSFIVFACLSALVPMALNLRMGCFLMGLVVIVNLVARKSTLAEFSLEPIWKH